MFVSQATIADFEWWKMNIIPSFRVIREYKFKMIIFTDASLSGWGSACAGEKIGGFWSKDEMIHSINYLELLAIFLGLKAFASDASNCEILLRVDNMTALSYINRMGGSRHIKYNLLTSQIWRWAEQRKILLFASYIPSSENTEADEQSRIKNIDTEWELAPYAYEKIVNIFGAPSIDLFASRVNKKCKIFCSWYKEPDASAIDAFTISWCNLNFYAFPPFAVISKVLRKIVSENATGIVVVPLWSTQNWFPMFKKLLIGNPIVLKPNVKLLLSPCRKMIHPLANQLTLVAGKLSGSRMFAEE
ncbi:hypothetical protein TKK_0013339 [Trichogramma kaykai]